MKSFILAVLLSMIMFQCKSETNIPIARLTMMFNGPQFLITPTCKEGQKYYFKVNGRYGVSNGQTGESMADAAYTTQNGYLLDSYHGPRYLFPETNNYVWQWNSSVTNKPVGDTYQSNHVYYYYFVGKGRPEILTYSRSYYEEGRGELTFELYNYSPSGDEIMALTKSSLTLYNLIIGIPYTIEWTDGLSGSWKYLMSFNATTHITKMNVGTGYGTVFYRIVKNIP